jgi:hypothetical protein
MRTGDAVIRSSTFRTLCECSLHLGLLRGAACPPCPRCRREVFWTFLRGEGHAVAASARRRPSLLRDLIARDVVTRSRLVG